MSKRYCLWLLLIFMLGICGCAKAQETSVRESNDLWKASDIMLKNLPPDASICGITDEGVYYCITLRTKMHGPELRDDLAWHFLSYSGEDINICETDCMYYCDDLQNDTDLILNITFMDKEEPVEKVLVLSPDGTVKEAAGENAHCIYASGEYLLIEQQYMEDNQWQEHLILLNTVDGTETTVYAAICGYDARDGLGDGEQIYIASLNDKEVLFTVATLEKGWYQQCSLYRYDIAAKKITDTILLDHRAVYAVCSGDLLLSEKSAEGLDENNAVNIGKIAKGEYQKLSEFPISSGRFFHNSAFNENGYYLTSYSSYCHFWNIDTNELYVYESDETEKIPGRDFATKQGIRYVIQKGDELFVRTLSVE